MPGSSKRSLSLRFPHQNTVCTPPLPIYAYVLLLNWIAHIIFGEEYRSLCRFLPCCLIPLRFWSNTTLKLSSFHILTLCVYMILYSLFFIFLICCMMFLLHVWCRISYCSLQRTSCTLTSHTYYCVGSIGRVYVCVCLYKNKDSFVTNI